MALEITNNWVGTRPGNPTIIRNTGSTISITAMTKSPTASGTIVDLVANTSITVNSNTAGRAFMSHSITMLANKTYVAMARFSNVVLGGTAAVNRMAIRTTIGANLAYGANSKTVLGDGLWAIVVQYSVDTATIIRFGTGTDTTITGASADISDFCVFQVPDFIADNGAIPPVIGAHTSLFRRAFAFNTKFANTYSSTGLVTEAAQTVPLDGVREKYRVGCYVSDSFGNDNGDWPDYLAQTYGYALFGGSWSGQNMAYFDARAADVFARTGLGYSGDTLPDFAICQSSLNSANSGHTSATMLADMTGLITKAKAEGLKPFIPNMTPYGATMSGAEETQLLAYNAALPALCASMGAVHIDVYTLVSDPSNRAVLLPAYTSDGIHLNATGVAVYADAINDAIVIRRNQENGNRPLIGNLLGSLISNLIT